MFCARKLDSLILKTNALLNATVVARGLRHDLPRCPLRHGLVTVGVASALGALTLGLLSVARLTAAFELDLERLDV